MNTLRAPDPDLACEGRGWPVGLIRADRIGRVRTINAAAQMMLGMVGERACAPGLFALLAPAQPALGPQAARLLAPGGSTRAVMRGAGGARLAATLTRETDGGLSALLVDDSATERAEAEAERQRARFEALADWSPRAAVWALDAAGCVATWSRSAEGLMGLKRRDAVGLPLRRVLRALRLDIDADALLAEAARAGGANGAGWRATAEAGPVWQTLTLRATRGREGCASGFVAVAGDMALADAREAALRKLAALDPLTGLLNRRAFFAAAAQALEAARAARRSASVVALDLDRFKALNDAHGHAAGDAALQMMAEAARAAARPGDLLGRLGGDEFAIVMPGAGLAAAMAAARGLGDAIAALRTPPDRGGARFTASFGVAACAGDRESLTEALARADAALYRAKAAGRNAVIAA